jgi:hypothetical protein
MGSHVENVSGSLKKFILKDGKKGEEYNKTDEDYEVVKQQVINREGCKLLGVLEVNKVFLNYLRFLVIFI